MTLIPTLSSRYYREQAIWEIERQEIFRKTWVMVGVEQELRGAAGEILEQVAGWPISVRSFEGEGLRIGHLRDPDVPLPNRVHLGGGEVEDKPIVEVYGGDGHDEFADGAGVVRDVEGQEVDVQGEVVRLDHAR